MTAEQIQSMTLQLEIRVAVAEDEFDRKRLAMERSYCEGRGWKHGALSSSQFKVLNRFIDGEMARSCWGRELSDANHALRQHKFRVARTHQGYAY